jgi:hypothetical protein
MKNFISIIRKVLLLSAALVVAAPVVANVKDIACPPAATVKQMLLAIPDSGLLVSQMSDHGYQFYSNSDFNLVINNVHWAFVANVDQPSIDSLTDAQNYLRDRMSNISRVSSAQGGALCDYDSLNLPETRDNWVQLRHQ